MAWIYLALISYFISALAFVVDKYLLAAPIPRPFAYAFWVSVLSATAVFLIPFGINVPPLREILLALACGMSFFVALVFFYRSVQRTDISVSATNAGTFTALFTALFSALLIGQTYAPNNWIGWGFLIVGILFLGHLNFRTLPLSLLAGAGFGLYFVLLKILFDSLNYTNAVFWSRLGYVGVASLALVLPAARKEISESFRQAPRHSKILFVANKALVGAAFLLLYYAIKIGDVVTINALMGFQFVFVLLLALLLRKRIPEIGENIREGVLLNKIIGIAMIVIGFVIVLIL